MQRRLWNDVEALIREGGAGIERKNDAVVLTRLSLMDQGWLSMIPAEWQEIYGALYDEATDKTETDMAKRRTEVYSAEDTIIDVETAVEGPSLAPTLYQRLHASDDKRKIAKDVHRTFSIFNKYESSKDTLGRAYRRNEEQFRRSLMDVLLAASYERGYCQGLNFIAGNFLLNFSHLLNEGDDLTEGKEEGDETGALERWVECERNSFICLCFLLRHSWIYILFDSRCSSLMEYMKLFEKKLRRHNNKVYRHWKGIGFDPLCVTVEWFTTCFVTVKPGDLANHALDLLLAGCEDALLKIGLALIDEVENEVLGMDLEQMQVNLKAVVRAAPVAPILARALTMPSHIFFPDTDMLLVMVRHIEEMQPRGEGGRKEYVYTTRPVQAPPARARMALRLKGEDEEEEEEEDDDDDDDDEEEQIRDEHEEGEGEGEGEVVSRVYFRNLGAAASLARWEAMLATGHSSEYVLGGHLSKLMRGHYRASNADNTEMAVSPGDKNTQGGAAAVVMRAGSPSPQGKGRDGRRASFGAAEADRESARDVSAAVAATRTGGPSRAKRFSRAAESKAERRRLRRHYAALIQKLLVLGPGQEAGVEAARVAQARVQHANGHLVSTFVIEARRRPQARAGAGLDGCRARSEALWTLGAMRGLDKTLYWKDAPRRRHWTHRLFTPRSTTQRVPVGAGAGADGRSISASSATSVQEERERSRTHSRESRLSRLVAVTDRTGRPGRKEGAGRGEEMAMRALQEAQRAERRKITNDDFLPVGWRDVCLPINRAQLGFMHGSTPTTTTTTGTTGTTGTTDEGASPVSSPSKSGAGGQGRGRRSRRRDRGRARRWRSSAVSIAYAAGLDDAQSSPPVGRDRRPPCLPVVEKGQGEEDEDATDKDGDGDGDGGGGTGAKEEQTPAVWGLLNTLTLGALDSITPLAGEVLSSAAALVESTGMSKGKGKGKGKGGDEAAEEVPSHLYDGDDERERPVG